MHVIRKVHFLYAKNLPAELPGHDLVYLYFMLLYIVPAAPPDSVTVVNISDSQITIGWEEVRCQYRNSNITSKNNDDRCTCMIGHVQAMMAFVPSVGYWLPFCFNISFDNNCGV